MEQTTLNDFVSDVLCVENERKAYSFIEHSLCETLRKDNLSVNNLFFRGGDSQNSKFSSVYLFSENNLFCRISFREKQNYVSIPVQYEKMIPEGIEYKVLASDPGFCRIIIQTPEDIAPFTGFLCAILEAQSDAYPADFGCCSRYEACSDAMKCIHPNPDMALRCTYRKNMKKGRIFYGKNKNI